jgi:hypothetical protein
MLQPSAIPTSVSSELTESFQQTLAASRIRTLKALGVTLALPHNLRSFLLFLLALIVVAAGMTMQIMLSMQIWQTAAKVAVLKSEYQAIEQQNTALVWEIAQQSTLENVRQRAETLGYSVALNRYYVPAPQSAHLATADGKPVTASPTTSSAHQSSALAMTVDTAALNITPEFSFTHNLHKAFTMLEQWWQKQWQKLLRKS